MPVLRTVSQPQLGILVENMKNMENMENKGFAVGRIGNNDAPEKQAMRRWEDLAVYPQCDRCWHHLKRSHVTVVLHILHASQVLIPLHIFEVLVLLMFVIKLFLSPSIPPLSLFVQRVFFIFYLSTDQHITILASHSGLCLFLYF